MGRLVIVFCVRMCVRKDSLQGITKLTAYCLTNSLQHVDLTIMDILDMSYALLAALLV